MDQTGRKSETTLCIIGLRQCFTLRARVKYVQTSVCSEVHHAGVIVDKHLVACAAAQGDGSRLPSENELAIAHFHGRHVAEIAVRLDQVDALTQGLAWGRQQWSRKMIVSFYRY